MHAHTAHLVLLVHGSSRAPCVAQALVPSKPPAVPLVGLRRASDTLLENEALLAAGHNSSRYSGRKPRELYDLYDSPRNRGETFFVYRRATHLMVCTPTPCTFSSVHC